MFGNKSHTERSVSVMLAEEILRAELAKYFSHPIYFVQVVIDATPVTKGTPGSLSKETATVQELQEQHVESSHREVKISAFFGPCRMYPGSDVDKRMTLLRVEAEARVFSIAAGSTKWEPHYLGLTFFDGSGHKGSGGHWRFYAAGQIRRGMVTLLVHDKSDDNPCQVMCENQHWGQPAI